MSNGVVNALIGAVITLGISGVVGGISLYGEVQVLKEQNRSVEKLIQDRDITTMRFTDMMHSLEKNVAVQTEVVSTLRVAVERLEETVYTMKQKETSNDRRN